MNAKLARAIFRSWPFPFAHVRLMGMLAPPVPTQHEIIHKLRGYNLRFTFDPRTYIGQYIYYRGIFEEQIINTIASCLRPGGTFVDIGANIGLHTTVAAHRVGERGKVIAFEPQSACRAQVEKNLRLNGLKNVTLYPVALGADAGQGRIFNIDSGNDGQATLKPGDIDCSSEEIAIVTLDSIDIPHGTVVKIDVEGGEMDVLRGCRTILAEKRVRHFFIEVIDEYLARFGSNRRELLQLLADSGYSLKGLINGRWTPITPAAERDMDIWAERKS